MGAPTPLEPKAFFAGRWIGDGTLRAHLFLRWLFPDDHVRLVSETEWHSEDRWTVRDRIEYGSGAVVERQMEAHLSAPDHITVTARDMPAGADIQLRPDRFEFSPYVIVTEYKRRRLRLRCLDTNVLTSPNSLRDTIRMYWGLFPVATMTLDVRIERGESQVSLDPQRRQRRRSHDPLPQPLVLARAVPGDTAHGPARSRRRALP